jgi:hypothetical protein
VYAQTVEFYRELFLSYEEGGFDFYSVPLDRWVLHYVFLDRINADLQQFVGDWNQHTFGSSSTAKGHSPVRLWLGNPHALGPLGLEDDLEDVEHDYGADDDGAVDEGVEDEGPDEAPFAGNNGVKVKEVPCPFNASQLDYFCLNVPKSTLLHSREQCTELFHQAYTSALEIINA